MAMMQLWAAVLITYGVSTGIAQIPLNMAPESVDDMYDGCSDKMNSEVEQNYLPNEINRSLDFRNAWNISEEAYWEKHKQVKQLKKEFFKAIYVYTLGTPAIYPDFNDAVRTQKYKYKTTFRYHALHFFLTRAIQTLNTRQPKEKKCLTTYRRTKDNFSQDVLNKQFRFGSFTSSSQKDYPAIQFGKKSCFEIFTCFGADIQQYSSLGTHEREVLIPPYEIFKVTNIMIKTKKNEEKICDVIYEVKSTKRGTCSNLNCALFHERGIRKITTMFMPSKQKCE